MFKTQSYLIEDLEIANLAEAYRVELQNHYNLIREWSSKLGAETVRLSSPTFIAGVMFTIDPGKEWKFKDGYYTPSVKFGKEHKTMIKELNEKAPNANAIFNKLGWPKVRLDNEILEPSISFVTGYAVLEHHVFMAKEQNSLDVYTYIGLKPLTENDKIRLELLRRSKPE